MTLHAHGTFEVQLSPQHLSHTDADAALGRLSIDKQFTGDLVATSQGEMLSARTSVESSAGYVAIEHVRGALDGRQGSFVLQHSGTVTRGAQHLVISIVPDSGTGDLAGLAGTMTLDITDGVHAYNLGYTLPDPTLSDEA